MNLTFPSTPATFRNFWEDLARVDAAIQHDPENGRNRFFEMQYLDFPYEDWDLSEFTEAVNARVSLSPQKYPEAQAMAIISLEVDGFAEDMYTVPASIFFFKVPRTGTTAADKQAAKKECFEATFATALKYRRFIRKYFKANTDKGTLEHNSFRMLSIRMPDSSNAMYGTRLDFRYSVPTTKCHLPDGWLIDPLA